ncbi:MFS transporter [Lacisediminihabitans changchengi]|uniref:MFS transporter n=1 Tax=Lacisediminihabitans changchengi TaxID=2787634 RepID=A0A934W375_9MICO|nr:MFS transporter [Lacisediminihabitans changchengi]MBK4348663.1 MFS transporter [Lacisediminihabitans changchengi]
MTITASIPQIMKAPARAFWVVAFAYLILVAQAGAPSPLYPVYAMEFALSPVQLTSVFAIYVVGLLLTLVTFGSLSDHVGRRPVILAGTVIAIAALIVFAVASDFTLLLVARALQGASIGVVTGALGAALIDLQSPSRPRLAAVLNGALPPIGLTVGSLSSGFLVQFAPDPTSFVFFVYIGLIAISGILIAFLPERAPDSSRSAALRSLRPAITIPPSTRRILAAVVGCMISSWALGGLYLGLGPTIVSTILHIDNHLAGALAVATLTGVGAITGLVVQGLNARTAMMVGAGALVVGPGLTVLALQLGSVPGFYLSTIVAGIGFGAGFQCALRLVLGVAPAVGRAGLLSTVYVISYLSLGLPSVVAGLLVPVVGLQQVIAMYAGFVALLAIIALSLQFVLKADKAREIVAERLAE